MARVLALIASAVFLLTNFAVADDFPEIRPGLWRIKTISGARSLGPMRQCIDRKSMKRMMGSGQAIAGAMCSQMGMKKQGDKYLSTARCNMGPMEMVVKSEITGDFQTSYTAVTDTEVTPPMAGAGPNRSVLKATYLGPCEDGMKPGDLITAEGQRMNVLETMEQLKNMPDVNEILQKMMQNMPRQ